MCPLKWIIEHWASKSFRNSIKYLRILFKNQTKLSLRLIGFIQVADLKTTPILII
jgi:hypothetical protein